MGVPRDLVNWLRSFLQDRLARVRVEGDTSPYAHLWAGLPQGSVLAPILFLVYIDDLVKALPPSVKAVLYADDIALIASAETVDACSHVLTKAMHSLFDWCAKWHMQVDVSKSTCTLFSLNAMENFGKCPVSVLCPSAPIDTVHEIHVQTSGDLLWSMEDWDIQLRDKTALELDMTCLFGQRFTATSLRLTHVNDQAVSKLTDVSLAVKWGVNHFRWQECLPYVDFPRYLGIVLDPTLSMHAQVDKLVKQHSRRCNLVRRLCGARWGPPQDLLRSIYVAYCQSPLEYCLSVLYPFMSTTTRAKLESCVAQGARLLSGCLRGTPTHICLSEASLVSLRVRAPCLLMQLTEKHVRYPVQTPFAGILRAEVPNALHWPASKGQARRLRTHLRGECLHQLQLDGGMRLTSGLHFGL
eukprot:2061062-Amphidinium_carterae.2